MTEEIYQMLLDNLHVTYTPDVSTERRIRNEGEAGIAYIRKYGDPASPCGPGTQTGALLCEYVLRAEAGALESFQIDYRMELLQLKAEAEANAYAEAVGYAEGE